MIDKEIIEANIVFTVYPQNIHFIWKLIPLLGKIRSIVALAPKKTHTNLPSVENGYTNAKTVQNVPYVFIEVA